MILILAFARKHPVRAGQHLEGYRELPGWNRTGCRTSARWLEENRPAEAPGIMHGDYHLNNVLLSCTSPRRPGKSHRLVELVAPDLHDQALADRLRNWIAVNPDLV